MTFEKMQSLVSVMSNEQFVKFETAVFELMQDNRLFTKSELLQLEKKVLGQKKLERENLLAVSN